MVNIYAMKYSSAIKGRLLIQTLMTDPSTPNCKREEVRHARVDTMWLLPWDTLEKSQHFNLITKIKQG